MMLLTGCGTTREKLATEQLLLSDAVDRSVAHIDFSPLRGETVFLDTSYVRQLKPASLVSSDYIISAMRQQMVLAGCLLQDNREQATYVVEARVGALGSDAHDVNFGVPGSQGISQAASLVSSVPMLPSLPEISFARMTDDSAAAKVAAFAYHRETRQPVWQSGTSVARSSAHARWVLGAGPFQSGSIYEGTRFAGDKFRSSPLKPLKKETLQPEDMVYRDSAVWDKSLQAKLREANTSEEQLAESESEEAGEALADAANVATAGEADGHTAQASAVDSAKPAVSTAGGQDSGSPSDVKTAEFKSDVSASPADPKKVPPVEKP